MKMKVSPTALVEFLQSSGWKVLPVGIPDGLYILQHEDYPRRQITFPIDQTSPDYADSVYIAIEKFLELLGEGE